ncbi:MAG TPA: hypothetical protein VG013_05635 [Gemmataceae bacterium]|jgi:hypothetical protein|nr:hypothetical protein [Gemmataceae bacterium]
MRASHYKVDYHLICVLYFSEQVPSGLDISLVWGALRVLGNRSVDLSFFLRGDTEISTVEKSTLGAPALNEVLVSKGDQLLSAAAASVRDDAANAILDSDVNFLFKRAGKWDGQTMPPILTLSVSADVIEQVGMETIIGVLKRVFNVADRSSPICGLVDMARPEDASAGMVYGSCWPRTAPLSRWIEHMGWLYSGANKGDRLRGLYWGNYVGPSILKRLGGQKGFVDLCAKRACNYDGTPNAHCWHLPNGVFVSLCMNPLDCRPGIPAGIHPAAEANLRWLVREMGTKGVLNHW